MTTRPCPDDAGLMTLEAASMAGDVAVDSAWHGAEAYHFWLLAHRQLYRFVPHLCPCVFVSPRTSQVTAT